MVLFFFIGTSFTVKAGNPVENLISSCTEATRIYRNKEEKALNAALTTSLAEALRAGYCRGVLDEYRRHRSSNCNVGNWLVQARYIAEQSHFQNESQSVVRLLRKSCD